MSVHQLSAWPKCDWCDERDSSVIESRIRHADLHERCVDAFCREHYPEDYAPVEDYCPSCGSNPCGCPEAA